MAKKPFKNHDQQNVETQEQEGAQEAAQETQPAAFDQDMAADINALQTELESARSKANEYLEGWQRSRAEFANYKKRVERDQAQVYQNAAGSLIKRYLEVADDLERALKNRPQEGEGAAWSNGIELVYRKLLSYLESEGVKIMDAEGQQFDPNLHEAISSEPSDSHEPGEIIEVVQQGYVMGDRVLRPAMVRVAR